MKEIEEVILGAHDDQVFGHLKPRFLPENSIHDQLKRKHMTEVSVYSTSIITTQLPELVLVY